MPLIGAGSIGDWDQPTLTKFIQEVLAGQLGTAAIQQLRVEHLDVVRQLALEDSVLITAKPYLVVKVGAANAPAFANSWAAYSASQPPAFYRDPFGRVWLQGMLKSGTVGSPAFTLPPGYRPAYQQTLDTISNSAQGRVDISLGGDVTPTSPSNNAWVSLDGLSFRAA